MKIPRKNQVYSFGNGPRYDIIRKIGFIRPYQNISDFSKQKRKVFIIHWLSGMNSITINDLSTYWQYKGFFFKPEE